MGGLADFNMFVRPQRELAERSFSGGAVTLCTFVVVLVVFATQLSAFFVPTLRSEVTVEQHRSERLTILVDIELAMACPLVAMVASDAHLTHDLDILRNVSKTRLDSGRKPVAGAATVSAGAHAAGREHHKHKLPGGGAAAAARWDGRTAAEVLAMAGAGEWCAFRGAVTVPKIPGRLLFRALPPVELEAIFEGGDDGGGGGGSSGDGGGGAAGLHAALNTSHYVRRLNFIDDRAAAGALGEVQQQQQQQQQLAEAEEGWGLGSRQETRSSTWSRPARELDADDAGGEGWGPAMAPGLVHHSLLQRMVRQMRALYRRERHSPLDMSLQLADRPRVEWHYDLQVLPVIRAGGAEGYRYGLGRSHFQAAEAAAEPGSAAAADAAQRRAKNKMLKGASVSFWYRVLPITIVYTETYRSWGDFLSGLLSVVGGIYAIAAMAESSFDFGARYMERKNEIGKLG